MIVKLCIIILDLIEGMVVVVHSESLTMSRGRDVRGVALESADAFWNTKLLPEAETLGVAEVMEERRRSVAVLWCRNDPHCGRCGGERVKGRVSGTLHTHSIPNIQTLYNHIHCIFTDCTLQMLVWQVTMAGYHGRLPWQVTVYLAAS